MNEPIIIWPEGTYNTSCSDLGYYYDCTYEYPEVAAYGGIACCPV